MDLASNALVTLEDIRNLTTKIEQPRCIMLGEASHGTSEFYTLRAEITKKLVSDLDYRFISVEGDWPDCYKINQYIKGESDYTSAHEVLSIYERWPTWMWANWEVLDLVEWLKDYNHSLSQNEPKVGFYGLDVYSLWESLDEIIKYLKEKEPEALEPAIQAFRCFEPFERDVQEYAAATTLVPNTCTEEVIQLLLSLQDKKQEYTQDEQSFFNAEQNALVAVHAEKYYRAMVMGGAQSWNIRDRHMMQTFSRLLDLHGSGSKGIVWAHNTHIGDARATDMQRAGMVNIGQLAREELGTQEVHLLGLLTYEGTVIAADRWGGEVEVMKVPKAEATSWEALFHYHSQQNQFVTTDREEFDQYRGNRAIGVVYHPEYEAYGNYVPTNLSKRYDSVIFVDQSQALHPLSIHPTDKPPQLLPFGV